MTFCAITRNKAVLFEDILKNVNASRIVQCLFETAAFSQQLNLQKVYVCERKSPTSETQNE